MYDITQRRTSQQNIQGLSTTETGNKYIQESIETEKANRRSSNSEDDSQSNGFRRKGSIRFYDEVHSTEDANAQRTESTSNLQQNDSEYAQKEYEYNETPQEYSDQSQQQQQEIYSQPDFTDQRQYEQSDAIYGNADYNTSQYIDQQNYDNQYGTNAPTSEYEYQSGYQGFDTQNYAESSDGQTLGGNLYQTEQYQQGETSQDYDTQQNLPTQQQSFTEPTSGATNTQRYKPNGSNSNTAVQRQSMSKQSTKKKFT